MNSCVTYFFTNYLLLLDTFTENEHTWMGLEHQSLYASHTLDGEPCLPAGLLSLCYI